jgi:hypothetical protein
MRLRRPKQLDETSTHYMLAVFSTIEESRPVYRRLLERSEIGELSNEEREEALEGAHGNAIMSMALRRAVASQEVVGLDERMPSRVHTVLASFSYAFGALAEPDPTPQALLSAAELDALDEKFGLAEWIAEMRELAPRLARPR